MQNMRKGRIVTVVLLLSFFLSANACAAVFDDHPAFRRKGNGTCYELHGQTVMRTVYVSIGEQTWTEEDITAWRKNACEAMAMIDHAAKAYGKHVSCEYAEYHVAFEDDVPDDYDEFVTECLLKNQALQSNAILLENEENVFTVFCFPNERRSMAYADWEGILKESVVAGRTDTAVELMHEILHLFGAVDLYFPEAFNQAAKVLYPDSIMVSTVGKRTIDSLTAYSIGWTDEWDTNARLFLEETQKVTQAMLDEAYEKELYTGYAVRHSEDNVQYGYLENGLINGYGICRWDNGDWYAGEFENGVMHGKGSYHWANGAVYSGDYLNGKRTGEGCMIWNGGIVYIGTFTNGEITGNGMYTWPEGSRYVGEVMNGVYHGYGIYTDANGNITEGYWKNGVLTE